MMSFDEIRIKIRYSHFLRLVFDAISKLGVRISPYYVFREGISSENPPALPTGFEEYEIKFWGPEEMRAMALIPMRKFSKKTLLQRLEDGQKCLGLKKDNALVAFTWCNFKEFSFKWHQFPLKPDEVYMFDAYTVPEYRGKGIAPFLRYHCYKEMKTLGRKSLYSYSDYFNSSAVKFKLKLNAQKVGLNMYVVLFNKWPFHFQLKDYSNKSKTT
jgi:hypothetical protein